MTFEWAISTRLQADKDAIILSNQPGSSHRPSRTACRRVKATTAKAGLDTAAPLVTTGKVSRQELITLKWTNKYK